MSLLTRLGALALTLLPAAALAERAPRPPQYVIISFDSASFIEQWERSRSLGQRTGARFTYFLSCVYLLSPETKQIYRAPGMKAGRSNIGFAASAEDVHARLDQIWAARGEGHEIASHACGHFDGGKWSEADWDREFDQFRTILRDAWQINGLAGEPEGWRVFAENGLEGFRAPYLAIGPALSAALAENGFSYDASAVSRGPAKPTKNGGIVHFSLPLIPEGPAKKRVIAMDYNLYVRHSGGFERPSQADLFAERAFDAFRTAFEREYGGERVPLQLGFHFTLMNNGAYWQALERFAEEVCVKPDVRCVSYSQYLDETASRSAESRASIDG
ncbi:polysaccharide deacetylase [Chelativorans sp. AA-79]|uniref:polysaccharide deacetylase n=1 Tax=Chelativorans sp. AA-79 TaxID=3028735 RepID=UPI0023F62322|nr:polysaccharide deacetylase [Chelativorans sp. AA-79]WEX08133.1 polysaccharide deacetylase [Chelativorans sp. AA-79]